MGNCVTISNFCDLSSSSCVVTLSNVQQTQHVQCQVRLPYFDAVCNVHHIAMLRWFPNLQVATACSSCRPPPPQLLNFNSLPRVVYMYVTAATGRQPNRSKMK